MNWQAQKHGGGLARFEFTTSITALHNRTDHDTLAIQHVQADGASEATNFMGRAPSLAASHASGVV